MKKIIVCFSLTTVTAISVFAAETAVKDKVACADKSKMECKSECCKGKSACSKTPSKQSLLSPKANEAKKN